MVPGGWGVECGFDEMGASLQIFTLVCSHGQGLCADCCVPYACAPLCPDQATA